jgi:hypothetical protein
MSTTDETTTAHKHAFPCNPPGGTFLNPGPCECGKTYAQNEADKALRHAVAALMSAYGAAAGVSFEADRTVITLPWETGMRDCLCTPSVTCGECRSEGVS